MYTVNTASASVGLFKDVPGACYNTLLWVCHHTKIKYMQTTSPDVGTEPPLPTLPPYISMQIRHLNKIQALEQNSTHVTHGTDTSHMSWF